MTEIELEDRAHCLYRFFGAGGTLLYVGITDSCRECLRAEVGYPEWMVWPYAMERKNLSYACRYRCETCRSEWFCNFSAGYPDRFRDADA